MLKFSLILVVVLLVSRKKAYAFEETETIPKNPAIVLAAYGTTDPGELTNYLHLENKVKDAFPCYDIHLAFVCDEYRAAWRARANDQNFRKYFPQIAEKFYTIKNVLTTLAQIQETGPCLILVQSLQLIEGPEYLDLSCLVDSLRKIKYFDRKTTPFPWLGLGSPAMGKGEGQKENLFRVASALKPIFDEAKEKNAAVVLVADAQGRGNPGVYQRLEDILERNYQTTIHVGIPEARYGVSSILEKMEKTELKEGRPIILAPLTLMVGEEMRNDLVGPQADSWLSLFKTKGFTVIPRLEGLATRDTFINIFIDSLKRLEEVVSHRYIN
ncbi:MAG: sirohydrochlorin cobaltochelatase [Deltaproteobacteria bacterium]|jgi:sirohydrochlorin cobaltochelatase|nr:sirohydrochlorin cobaltochelatase [Deltaproteobacteria bacterium]